MIVEASVGRAKKTASLDTEVQAIKLSAQTQGEKQWLAGLLKAIEKATRYGVCLKAQVPDFYIGEHTDNEEL